jgi:hypothetical protein
MRIQGDSRTVGQVDGGGTHEVRLLWEDRGSHSSDGSHGVTVLLCFGFATPSESMFTAVKQSIVLEALRCSKSTRWG